MVEEVLQDKRVLTQGSVTSSSSCTTLSLIKLICEPV